MKKLIQSVAINYTKVSAELAARHARYLAWANSPHQFKSGPSGKPLLKLMDVLYENKFSHWLAGKS